MIDIEEHRAGLKREVKREEEAEASGKAMLIPPIPLSRSTPEHPEFE